jgi:hypothetical protein
MSIDQRLKAEENAIPEGQDAALDAPSSNREESSKALPPKAVEPTRFGDWERAGRCIDF